MANNSIPNAVKEAYMNWLLTPPGEREISTKTAFAQAHDISDRTLYYWEEEEEFQRALRQIKAKWGAKWHGEILSQLMEIVRNGSDNAKVSASKVLLSHLKLPQEQDKEAELSQDQKSLLMEMLEGAGYKVIRGD